MTSTPVAVIPVHGYRCPECGDHMLNLENGSAPMFTFRSTCLGCKATYRIDERAQLMERVEYSTGYSE